MTKTHKNWQHTKPNQWRYNIHLSSLFISFSSRFFVLVPLFIHSLLIPSFLFRRLLIKPSVTSLSGFSGLNIYTLSLVGVCHVPRPDPYSAPASEYWILGQGCVEVVKVVAKSLSLDRSRSANKSEKLQARLSSLDSATKKFISPRVRYKCIWFSL